MELSALFCNNNCKTILENPVLAVDTIDDLPACAKDQDVCFVRDLARGGLFVYYEDLKEINDDGVIINGWVRQYQGLINVRWFGAVGDGETDDTKAFQSISKYKIIYIPNGNYSISETISFQPYTKIYGDGLSSKIIYKKDDENPVFKFENAPGCAIKNLAIERDKNLVVNNKSQGAIIYAKNSSHLTIDNCVLKLGKYGVYLDSGCYISKITKGELTNLKTAIYIESGDQVDILIDGVTFGTMLESKTEDDHTIYDKGQNTKIVNCYFETINDYWTIYSEEIAQEIIISNNEFFNSGGIYSLAKAIVSNNVIYTNDKLERAIDLGQGESILANNLIQFNKESDNSAVALRAGKCKAIANNIVSKSAGISLASSGYCIVSNNTIKTNKEGIKAQGGNDIITQNIIETDTDSITGVQDSDIVKNNIEI